MVTVLTVLIKSWHGNRNIAKKLLNISGYWREANKKSFVRPLDQGNYIGGEHLLDSIYTTVIYITQVALILAIHFTRNPERHLDKLWKAAVTPK